jgi:hypothetical protein
MKNIFLNILFLLTSFLISSVCIAQELINVTDLKSIGNTTYRYFGFKVYDAEVFLDKQLTSIDAFNQLGKKRVVLSLKYDVSLKKQDFIESGKGILEEYYPDEFEKVKDKLKLIDEIYKDVQAGDKYLIDFTPGNGIRLYLNDIFQGQVNDDEFAKVYLKIWKEDVFDRI